MPCLENSYDCLEKIISIHMPDIGNLYNIETSALFSIYSDKLTQNIC
jgi:hypothetical protein